MRSPDVASWRYGAAALRPPCASPLWLTMENPATAAQQALQLRLPSAWCSPIALCASTACPSTRPARRRLAVAAVSWAAARRACATYPGCCGAEYFCIAWFSFEVSRLLLAPSTRNFFCHPLNLIDIVSVLPFYLTLLAGARRSERPGGAGGAVKRRPGQGGAGVCLMRIFRVLKLARATPPALRSLGAYLKVGGGGFGEVGVTAGLVNRALPGLRCPGSGFQVYFPTGGLSISRRRGKPRQS